MKTRKQMKRLGRMSLKKHYVIFVAACLIAAFLASEFTSSLNFSTVQNYETTYDQVQSDLNGDSTYSIKTGVDSIGWGDVIRIIVEDNMQAGKEMSQEIRRRRRYGRMPSKIPKMEIPCSDVRGAYCQIL